MGSVVLLLFCCGYWVLSVVGGIVRWIVIYVVWGVVMLWVWFDECVVVWLGIMCDVCWVWCVV